MINSVNKYKNYSKSEAELLNAGIKLRVFSAKDLKRILGWKRTKIHNTLSMLKKKNKAVNIKKNLYTLSSDISENIFMIAVKAVEPAYISFWTACSYYNLTEQQLRAVQLVSTKQYPEMQIDSFLIETITYKPERFYGYITKDNFVIAEKEKLVVDMLFKPERTGGMDETRKCLRNMWRDIEEKKLLNYLKRFNNRSIYARLGYLSEELVLKNNIKKELQKNLPQSIVKLNPQKKKKKNTHKKWRIDIND